MRRAEWNVIEGRDSHDVAQLRRVQDPGVVDGNTDVVDVNRGSD
jgi:hypothetical protein